MATNSLSFQLRRDEWARICLWRTWNERRHREVKARTFLNQLSVSAHIVDWWSSLPPFPDLFSSHLHSQSQLSGFWLGSVNGRHCSHMKAWRRELSVEYFFLTSSLLQRFPWVIIASSLPCSCLFSLSSSISPLLLVSGFFILLLPLTILLESSLH